MAKIYAAPEHLIKPDLRGGYDTYEAACEEYEKSIVEFCTKEGSGDLKGKIVAFPVADGYARYVVYNDAALIHIDTGDAYNIPDAHARGLIKKDIEHNVKMRESMNRLFSASS